MRRDRRKKSCTGAGTYADRYHSPSDDLQQPWDPQAAAKFNDFYQRLVETVANADERPRWKAGSKLAPAATK